MAYERKIVSLEQLFSEIELLDADSGVRVVGDYGASKSFVFVTKHSGRYALAISRMEEAGKGRWLPAKQPVFKEFSDIRSLREFLARIVSKPLEAYIY